MIELSISGHVVTMTLGEFTLALLAALVVGVSAGIVIQAIVVASRDREDD